MIHDKERVAAFRARVLAQIALIKSLKAQVAAGEVNSLDMALKQAEEVATFFIADLDRQNRTPMEEASWLSKAEYMLGIWQPYLKRSSRRLRTSNAAPGPGQIWIQAGPQQN